MNDNREIKKSELRPAFVYLHRQGKTFTEIADFFGVKRQTVSDAVRRFDESGSNGNRPGSVYVGTLDTEVKSTKFKRKIYW